MKTLLRKLLRDLWSSKGLFAAVILVIFLAVAFFGSMSMANKNLSTSYQTSYEKLRFADFTVKIAGNAGDIENELSDIDGVEALTGRMNADCTLTLPGGPFKNVEARVLSLPASMDQRAKIVNDVHIETGTYFDQSIDNSILIEKNFAEYHDLKPGQTVFLTVYQKQVPFIISGIAASPEYIFPAKSKQELLASSDVWGVVFVTDDIRTNLFELAINEYCFLIEDDVNHAAIFDVITTKLSPYGIIDAVPRDEQPSFAGLEIDLEQFESLSQTFPILFIIVGAMAIYILLTRIIYNQKTQIGLMRAVGYSQLQVMGHYLGFALVVGITGSVLGSIAGYLLAEGLTNFYASMINLPFTSTDLQTEVIIQGFFLGIVPCVITGFIPAWHASNIAPAEAMRTPAPVVGKKLFIERVFPFLTRLSSLWKIPLRSVFRNPRRSVYTIIGIIIGISLILVSAAMIDSMIDLMDLQFNKINRYDVRIHYTEARSGDMTAEVSGWDGVERVEPILQLPVVLQYGEEKYTTQLVAIPSDSQLRGIYTPERDRISVSDDGLMLTEALRDTLDIDEGDTLSFTVQIPNDQTIQGESKVVGFVKDPMGSFAYTTMNSAHSIIGGIDIITGMLLQVDVQYEDEIREKAASTGASVELASETRKRIDEMLEAGIGMLYIMLLFGATLSMAIVFTTVTVNLLERRREIATMRTIGESKIKISAMITIENLILGFLALIPGMVAGYFLGTLFFSMFQSDMFSMDLVVFPRTYAMTVGIVILVMLLSQIPGIRNANRLNLAQVTKEQAS